MLLHDLSRLQRARRLKGRDHSVPVPKLHYMAVDKLPGLFFRLVVIVAVELDAVRDVFIQTKDVRPVAVHSRAPKMVSGEFRLGNRYVNISGRLWERL